MTAEPELRVATTADLDALVELAVAFRDHLQQAAPSAAAFAASFARLLCDDATEFLVAADATRGRLLGYVQVRYRDSAWTSGLNAELEDVFVAAAARRRGVGQRLVQFVLDRAAARGCVQVGLTTNERNAAALSLYTGLGFTAERVRWDGGRQLWLEKPLADG